MFWDPLSILVWKFDPPSLIVPRLNYPKNTHPAFLIGRRGPRRTKPGGTKEVTFLLLLLGNSGPSFPTPSSFVFVRLSHSLCNNNTCFLHHIYILIFHLVVTMVVSTNSVSRTIVLLVAIGCTINYHHVDAFVPLQKAGLRILPTVLRTPFRASTLEPPTTTSTTTKTTNSTMGQPTTWECDEDAQCVEVPACDDEGCRTSLDVRIHGEWYDLTGELLLVLLLLLSVDSRQMVLTNFTPPRFGFPFPECFVCLK